MGLKSTLDYQRYGQLSIGYRSYRSHTRTIKKTQFLQSSSRVDTAVWMHYMDANKTYGEKAWRQLHKNSASNIEQVLEAEPHKTAAVRPPTAHHENYQS